MAWHECSVELQNSIQRIQHYGMRLILNRPPRTPSDELRRALKWDTLFKEKVQVTTCSQMCEQVCP